MTVKTRAMALRTEELWTGKGSVSAVLVWPEAAGAMFWLVSSRARPVRGGTMDGQQNGAGCSTHILVSFDAFPPVIFCTLRELSDC
jgi:hypothetical protein